MSSWFQALLPRERLFPLSEQHGEALCPDAQSVRPVLQVGAATGSVLARVIATPAAAMVSALLFDVARSLSL